MKLMNLKNIYRRSLEMREKMKYESTALICREFGGSYKHCDVLNLSSFYSFFYKKSLCIFFFYNIDRGYYYVYSNIFSILFMKVIRGVNELRRRQDSLVERIFKWFSPGSSNINQKRNYTSTTIFDHKKVPKEMAITDTFNKEVITEKGSLKLEQKFLKDLRDAFSHESVFNYVEMPNGMIKIITFQKTHSKVIRYKDGSIKMSTISLGRGEDGRKIYIGVEGKSFFIKKRRVWKYNAW